MSMGGEGIIVTPPLVGGENAKGCAVVDGKECGTQGDIERDVHEESSKWGRGEDVIDDWSWRK